MELFKKSAKLRDASVELYRIVLMFGICLQHCVGQGQWSTNGFPKNILGACVPGFIFISGWFGVRFSLSKLIRLYSVPVYASLLAPLCGCAWKSGEYWREVIRVWHADGGFWFIHAYAVLMVFAPMINVVLKRSSNMKEAVMLLSPVIAMGLGWGALRHYRCLGDYIPSTPGLESGSGLTLLAIYCVGRLLRSADIESKISVRGVLFFGVALAAIVSFTGTWLSTYNNPVCVGVAACGLLLFKKMPVRGVLARTVLWLSPLMFAVYCISGTIYFPGMLHDFFALVETAKMWVYSQGIGTSGAMLGAAAVSFVVGVVFALPQYLMALMLKRPLCTLYAMLDGLFERIVLYIERGLSKHQYLK